ncbi:glycosyltransferase [Lamprobacter modestohalophilus]|uniref:glycosyltransferase n=1 Tax=Lamprobacter modestohalophilus TaxID=1064514 RepID=UPI002ADEF49C|nr:glycosyltransferase [Lamprobacter modestohalophilus]MEA1048331.1 glycosyltransferase [Lamprobacter modestohalophilus]
MTPQQPALESAVPDDPRPHVVIVYTDAGGGHRASAQALRSVLEADGRYRATLVNPYQEVLAHLDPFTRLTGRNVEATYNELVLGGGRTGLFCRGFFILSFIAVAFLRRAGRREFARLWAAMRPDLVISVLPVLNPAMIDAIKTYRGGAVPFAIMMTDWAEISPFVWFPKGDDYAAISGTEQGLARLRAKRHPEERIFPTGGLLIRPQFHEPLPNDFGAARAEHGLEPERPTIVMSYGGHGGPRMVELADALAAADAQLQVIFLCGRNETLARRLQSAHLPFPHLVLGYRDDIHRYLALADLFVGKAGPQSISEALALGLPLLIDEWRVLPQERALTRWVKASGVGATFRRPSEFVRVVQAMAAQPRSCSAREAAQRNTAAGDILRIVETLIGSDWQDAAA